MSQQPHALCIQLRCKQAQSAVLSNVISFMLSVQEGSSIWWLCCRQAPACKQSMQAKTCALHPAAVQSAVPSMSQLTSGICAGGSGTWWLCWRQAPAWRCWSIITLIIILG